jgi:hypothetical protein
LEDMELDQLVEIHQGMCQINQDQVDLEDRIEITQRINQRFHQEMTRVTSTQKLSQSV